MTNLNRRRAIIDGLILLSGCVTNGESDEKQQSASSSPTQVAELDVTDPTVTRTYGEAFRNATLEVTVETPTIETSFRIETERESNDQEPTQSDHTDSSETTTSTTSTERKTGTRQVELSDGRAIVLAPVKLSNQREKEDIRISAPNFVLIGPGKPITETQSISHPAIEDHVSPSDMAGFSDLFWRWTMHGTGIEAGETVEDIAMFEVPADTTLDEFDIVFDPYLNSVGNEYFEPRTAAWSR